MEVALVSTVLKIVGTKLVPLAIKEFSSKAGVAKDLHELQDLLEEINEWLYTVGDKAIRNGRSSKWLKKLKEAAYDAEDLVHEFHIEVEKQDIEVSGGKNTLVKYLLKKPKSAVSEFKIAHKIKALKSRFDAIVKGRSDYSTIAHSMPVDHPVQHTRKTIGELPFCTIVDETSVFGRDQEKNQITSELIETNSQERIKIVSVIGLGGSGKTTLAKLVFNDGNIVNHFEVLLWVHVSREFVVEKLVEKLFEAIASDKPNYLPPQHVSRTISEKLAGKRFLAVLDDVWTEDRVDWERFMVHLKIGAPGSSILLTTRSRKVAEAVDSTYAYDLPFLAKKDSWKVFQQCFGISMKALDTEFLQVGKEIVEKCGGVPLAIKVIAGVLHGMKGIEEWLSISNSNLLDVQNEESRVFTCLWLSFIHLPDHLKPCFLHCSIFPRGYVISRRLLISQWIAHGFVPTIQARQPEDVGMDYFDSLLKVGFLQDEDQYQSSTGDVVFKMHDLIHDLARQILKDEFVSGIETNDQMKRCRYLSLSSCSGKLDNKLCGKVRALYVSGRDLTFNRTMNKKCCVRTIILKYTAADSLPLFVSKFEYLGYLEISNVNCELLPEALSDCWNLQAIHVIECIRLTVLPESIGRLKKLRTLELNNVRSFMRLPESIGDCDNLQSLYLRGCQIEVIPNSLEKMEKLRIFSIMECNLQKLLPPESFVKLSNLHTIELSRCWSLQQLPLSITSLSHLESLDLGYCRELVELPEGIGNLRNLKVLKLEKCTRLCGLPVGFGKLTRLQQLSLFVIGDSTKHARISELESIDKLNGKLRIKNIKYVKDPGEADKVRLKEKNGIQKLSLDWYSGREVQPNDVEEESSLNMEKDLHLLNNLEPPSKIERLRIRGYRGSQLPHWMTKQSDSCSPVDDMHVVLQRNPPEFSLLTKLVLDRLPNLEHMGELVELPLIKILKVRRMPKLVELLTTTADLATTGEGVEMQCCFPHLSTLVISDCPKLVVKPYFPLSLQSLTLEGSNGQLVLSGCFFQPRHRHGAHAHGDGSSSSSCIVDVTDIHLKRLNLGRLIGSSSGWEVLQHLTGLHTLEIYKCTDLTHLPESMHCLTCLRSLSITFCANLRVLPDWLVELKSLQSLHLESCDALQQLPEQIGELSSLQHISIYSLPSLTCLPESMQRLTSLRSLYLFNCHTLTQLPEWLGELSALQRLAIQSCRGVTSLPRSIQRLTALQAVFISYNPELVRRCREGVGED